MKVRVQASVLLMYSLNIRRNTAEATEMTTRHNYEVPSPMVQISAIYDNRGVIIIKRFILTNKKDRIFNPVSNYHLPLIAAVVTLKGLADVP